MPWEASIRLTGISMARSRTSTGRGSTSGSHRLAPRGVHFGDDSAARILARGCNDYLSAIRRDRPDRFGAVATLPLPDIEGSLEQIAYALDVLELDGLSVMTNADGSYLGDTRGARVRPPDHVPRRSRTRSVSLTRSSNSSSTRRARSRSSTTATRSPKTQDVKYVFVHAGGTIQYLAPRFAIVDEMDVIPGAQDPWGAFPDVLPRLCWDTASPFSDPCSTCCDRSRARQRHVRGRLSIPATQSRSLACASSRTSPSSTTASAGGPRWVGCPTNPGPCEWRARSEVNDTLYDVTRWRMAPGSGPPWWLGGPRASPHTSCSPMAGTRRLLSLDEQEPSS